MKPIGMLMLLTALGACAFFQPAAPAHSAVRVENEGNTPYNRMRTFAASLMCALALAACSDTQQAVPVDSVEISNSGAAQ